MKIRSKDSVRAVQKESEFRLVLERWLNLPPHEGVVPLQEVLENDTHYFIVMERASGGPLLTGLVSQYQDGVVPGARVREVVREILEALRHVHGHGMLHRDMKPDNMVLREVQGPAGPHLRVALIDFDHALPDYQLGSPKKGSFCGTLAYNAPETYLGLHSPASDLYSVGVVLYLIMTGRRPYDDGLFDLDRAEKEARRATATPLRGRVSFRETMAVVHRGLVETPVDWECDPWPRQTACRHFCRSLLDPDPLLRPASAQDALAMNWLAQDGFCAA